LIYLQSFTTSGSLNMTERNPNEEDSKPPPPERAVISTDEDGEAKQDERAPENWASGVGSGIKGVSQKLLDKVPPELRQKVIERARTHGPGAAAVAVNAAALKTRNFKAKIALKKLLNVLESKVPKKQDDQENKKEP